MIPEGVGMIAAATAALGLGLGLGFRWGKLYGMKLGIEARDFAESFGIGRQGVQTGKAAALPYTVPPGAQSGLVQVRAGGGGIAGGYSRNNLAQMYADALKYGMAPADAQKLLTLELQRQQQQQQFYGLVQQKAKGV
jgi:hypothetical protein